LKDEKGGHPGSAARAAQAALPAPAVPLPIADAAAGDAVAAGPRAGVEMEVEEVPVAALEDVGIVEMQVDMNEDDIRRQLGSWPVLEEPSEHMYVVAAAEVQEPAPKKPKVEFMYDENEANRRRIEYCQCLFETSMLERHDHPKFRFELVTSLPNRFSTSSTEQH